jgi:hypothetical protein
MFLTIKRYDFFRTSKHTSPDEFDQITGGVLKLDCFEAGQRKRNKKAEGEVFASFSPSRLLRTLYWKVQSITMLS